MTLVSPDELNRWVDFDSPFRVDIDGNVTTASGIHAPAVYHVEGEREPEVDGTGWEFVDGYSGQHGYSGPVMHASEQLAGGIARDVLADPGVYVVTVVEDLDDMDNPAGWVLLKHQTED